METFLFRLRGQTLKNIFVDSIHDKIDILFKKSVETTDIIFCFCINSKIQHVTGYSTW